jgi:membrane protein
VEWLKKLPVIGPAATWFLGTRLWRVYRHLDERKWDRLAASVTFTSFISLFPMLAVFAAVGASLLSPERMRTVQHTISRQVPGISEQLDLQSFADNAGTIGLIAGLALIVTGVNWVGTLRESLRSVWDLEEDPGNPVLLKLKDFGALAGLGAVGLVSLGGSAFAVSAVSWVAGQLGLREGGVGTVLLSVAGYGAAVAADFALLWYVLTVLPGVRPPRRPTLLACAMGAVGFELLKLLMGGYLQSVATKSVYGAFGTPIALLLWISFMTKLMLFCASWTATERTLKPIEKIDALGSGAPEPPETEGAAPAPGSGTDEADGTDETDGTAAKDGDPVSRTSEQSPGPPPGPHRERTPGPRARRLRDRRGKERRRRFRLPSPGRREDGAGASDRASASGGEPRRPDPPPGRDTRR